MKLKLYDLIDDPFRMLLPENSSLCTRKEIDNLHKETCENLGILDIYPEILWSFTKKLRHLAEAVYWKDSKGLPQWRINYDTKRWIALGSEGRKNTIIHEVCHIAVEKIYGHTRRPKKGEEAVTDHGKHWQDLMYKCNQPPFPECVWVYR